MLTSEELREIRATTYGVCTIDERMTIRPCPVRHLLSHIKEQAKEIERLQKVEAAVVRFAEAQDAMAARTGEVAAKPMAYNPTFAEWQDAQRELLRLGKEAHQ